MSTTEFFTDNFPTPEQITKDLQESAFKVYDNAIATDVYDKIILVRLFFKRSTTT